MKRELLVNSVANLRAERGLTQQALAEAVGVTRQTIIAIEHGHYVPSLLLAMKVAKFFRRPIEAIFKLRYDS